MRSKTLHCSDSEATIRNKDVYLLQSYIIHVKKKLEQELKMDNLNKDKKGSKM